MVKITNGVNIFEVTDGAYENNFKKLGYKIVNEKGSKAKAAKQEVEADNADNAVEEKAAEETIKMSELVEKPLSNWTKDEVKKFAKANEIDITGTKGVDEAKERINDFLVANV